MCIRNSCFCLFMPYHCVAFVSSYPKSSTHVHSNIFLHWPCRSVLFAPLTIFHTAGCRLHQTPSKWKTKCKDDRAAWFLTHSHKHTSFSYWQSNGQSNAVQHGASHFWPLSERGTRWARPGEPSADASWRFDLHLKPTFQSFQTYHRQSNLFPQMGSELCGFVLFFLQVSLSCVLFWNGFRCSAELGKANSHQQQVTSWCQTTSQFIGMSMR